MGLVEEGRYQRKNSLHKVQEIEGERHLQDFNIWEAASGRQHVHVSTEGDEVTH